MAEEDRKKNSDIPFVPSYKHSAYVHRESTGTVASSKINMVDPVSAAEEIAFCRACARFGLGLYLYHEE
ncbi:hypothetical protein Gohar_002854 [Gossypium harknessii]|uniref:Uncharacterized protein n=1 Tax=Gossypium harknessii TaxID=34285 RepID=A0A7J9HMQ8_9ROSI|nr:hypothetical protein [Gossypium harknessii]